MSIEATPRYRNFSNNIPASTIHPTPRAPVSTIAVEKEPAPDPEEICFMCRQSNIYVKPIGMQQERRVAQRYPPPLTQAEIDELSRKKHLTKQEVRKLLQCYFPEIKGAKYFQLHKYHSCCYDPKHINLCKNHITALQLERSDDPNHRHRSIDDDDDYKNNGTSDGKKNRVSFVRIRIEPTKGIPTRFLGPAALPESLAEMLLKQVNRLENKKTSSSYHDDIVKPYRVTRIYDPQVNDNDDDYEDDDDDDDDNYNDDGRGTQVNGNDNKTRLQSYSANGDLVVEDLDELNKLYVNPEDRIQFDDDQHTDPKVFTKKTRKKGTKKNNAHAHRKPKLKHWELKAIEQSRHEACNCRHHVLRMEADKLIYDWCRCKDHQHKELYEKHKAVAAPPPPTAELEKPPAPPVVVSTPPPPIKRPKPRKAQKKSVAIDATEPTTTELALAYDPSAVDYDMIQEVIYYRTSSGRLIKPEVTNAFTYDTLPQSMMVNQREKLPNKAEVLYMTPNGQLQMFESGARYRGPNRSNQARQVILSNPGSLYNGHATVDPNHSSNGGGSDSVPVLKLPSSMVTPRQNPGSGNRNQPNEYTLARFSPMKTLDTPVSPHSLVTNSSKPYKNVPLSMQKSTKPTYSNEEPTPNYGRESSVVANRRWFDQPLGDQNLRPIRDGQYGLIAGTSAEQYQMKSQMPPAAQSDLHEAAKNEGNCTIS